MERIKNDFTHEVKMRFADFKDGYEHNNAMLDDAEDVADDFIHKAYNTELETETDCFNFITHDLRVYLEMDKYVRDYWLEEMGEEYTEYGVVKIVSLWKYLYAKSVVEEIINQ